MVNTEAGLPETSAGRALAAEHHGLQPCATPPGAATLVWPMRWMPKSDASSGAYPHMAADQLAARPEFKEVNVSTEELSELPAGAHCCMGQNRC